jgi:IS30 family transposase
LKVSKSTISREILKRKKETGEYDGFVAEHKARIKRSNSKHCGMKIEKDAFLKSFIEKALKEKQSPESISGRLKVEQGMCISHTSIYK